MEKIKKIIKKLAKAVINLKVYIRYPEIYSVIKGNDYKSPTFKYDHILANMDAYIRYPESVTPIRINSDKFQYFDKINTDINNATISYLRRINYSYHGKMGVVDDGDGFINDILNPSLGSKGKIEKWKKNKSDEYNVIIFNGPNRCEAFIQALPFVKDSAILILTNSEGLFAFQKYLRWHGFSQVDIFGFYYSQKNYGFDSIYIRNFNIEQVGFYTDGKVTKELFDSEKEKNNFPTLRFNSDISFGQEAEDIIVSKMFKDVKDGFYVDLGAYHPVRFSNTYTFYRKGWHGLNVEPSQQGFDLLASFRPRDTNARLLVGEKTGFVTLYIMNEQALNTVSLERKNYLEANTHYHCVGEDKIQMVHVNDLFEDYVPKEQDIHILNIDVENLEVEIIGSLDLEKYKPKVILIESRFFEIEKKKKIDDILLSNGYVEVASTTKTRIYALAEIAEELKL